MMKFGKKRSVSMERKAEKQFLDLDFDTQRRIREHLSYLSEDPFTSRPHADIRKVTGGVKSTHRLRVGDYRLLYAIDEDDVFITRIIHRKEDYRFLD